MTRPRFIDHGGEQVYQQPFLAEGVRYYGFLLEADAAALQTNVCDRFFNEPSGGQVKFRPVGGLVLLAFCDLQALRSETPPYSNYGWFAEREAAIWVPLFDEARNRMFWSFPYIWVDNAYAMTMGREMYGFPKELGEFNIPPDPKNAAEFSVSTLVLPHYSPETKGSLQQIIEIHQTHPRPDIVRDFGSVEEIAGEVLGQMVRHSSIPADLRETIRTAEDLLRGRAPMVFLKQFRDVAQGAEACYQSIVEVVLAMTKFKGAGLLGDYEINLSDFDSHPIRKDLGLKDGPLHPLLSFWAEFDMIVPAGVEVWKA